MARQTGNQLWWSQVQSLHNEIGGHYRDVELELFARLLRVMLNDQMTMEAIRNHFKTVFSIGYSAFYSRMKKMGVKWVLPIELRKEPTP